MDQLTVAIAEIDFWPLAVRIVKPDWRYAGIDGLFRVLKWLGDDELGALNPDSPVDSSVVDVLGILLRARWNLLQHGVPKTAVEGTMPAIEFASVHNTLGFSVRYDADAAVLDSQDGYSIERFSAKRLQTCEFEVGDMDPIRSVTRPVYEYAWSLGKPIRVVYMYVLSGL